MKILDDALFIIFIMCMGLVFWGAMECLFAIVMMSL